MTDLELFQVNPQEEVTHSADVGELVRQLQDLAAFVQDTEESGASIPDQIGRYRVVDDVGRGGQARVFLGYDSIAQRTVIIKWYVDIPPSNLEQFISETRAICSVEHPRIIRCWDVDFEQNCPFLVLEPVAGKPLSLVAKQLRCRPELAAEWMIEICNAVHTLHQQGWGHGDLSPQNIVINNNDEPILIDFGLARRVGSETSLVSPGTRDFRAPELEQPGSQANPIQSDIFSLGAILDWLMKSSSRDSSSQVLKRAGLERVIQRATEPQPETRFANVAEMAGALENWLRAHRFQTYVRRTAKRLTILALISLSLIAVTGWGWRRISNQQTEQLQQKAWEAFTAHSTSARHLDPKFRNDFNLGVSFSTSKYDDQGRLILETNEPFDVTLKPDQSCYVTVFLLGDSKSESPLQGSQIHPSQGISQWVPAHQEHQILLAPTFDNGRTELLYIIASTEPWDAPSQDNHPGSLTFELQGEAQPSLARGIHPRAAVAESLITFVVQ